MNHLEQKLLYIYQKEGVVVMAENASIATLDVSDVMYAQALSIMDDKHLCRHFRDMIVLEEYETADLAKAELNRRGYIITFKEKSICFTP